MGTDKDFVITARDKQRAGAPERDTHLYRPGEGFIFKADMAGWPELTGCFIRRPGGPP